MNRRFQGYEGIKGMCKGSGLGVEGVRNHRDQSAP